MFQEVISQSQQFWSQWGDLCRERLESASEETARQQRTQADRTAQLIDEAATLTKASVERTITLAEQWRTLGLDAWRRSLDLMKAPESATVEG